MASSPPVKPPGPTDTPPPPATKWPRWRVSMLAGAIVLLVSAILDAAVELPRWLYVAIFFVGYVFLAYGFFLALSAKKGRSTPRGRG